MSVDASKRAQNWAAKKKQALDKANQFREERKYNFAKAGEMSVANNMGYAVQRRIPSSESQQKPAYSDFLPNKPSTAKYGTTLMGVIPSEEEVMQAEVALRLLKAKRGEPNRFSQIMDNEKRGYFDEETHEYMQYAPGDRMIEPDQDYNDIFSNGNPNYRKVFKPVFKNQQNQQANINKVDRTLDKKTILLELANKYGPPRPDFGPRSYEPPQSLRDNTRPIPKMNRYVPHVRASENLDELPPKNIPSRIPKTTLNSNKAKNNKNMSSYDEEFLAQPDRKKYTSYKASIEEDEEQPAQSFRNSPQKTKVPAPKAYEIDKKSNDWNEDDESQENEQNTSKTYPKPILKKKAPANVKKESQTQFDDKFVNGLDDVAALGDAAENDGNLQECPHGCGRKFNPESLEKHANICQKVFQTKRKKFDSSQKRTVEGQDEVENADPYYSKKLPKKPARNPKGGQNSKWKGQSEAFRAAMRAARGENLSKEEQSALNANQDNLVACHSCGRKFNEQAAARHIPFCESKQKVDSYKKGGRNI